MNAKDAAIAAATVGPSGWIYIASANAPVTSNIKVAVAVSDVTSVSKITSNTIAKMT
ncbi:MAG: hypothetical protein FD120_1237 [Gammaproteobacteria bacterium]|nr:MAG: hypothetical protein FD120_1237 [Gammaproteobacteria bacterium]